MAKKTRKERIPLGVRQEFDDIDYWSQLKKSKETVTLKDGTILTVYEWHKRFMQEAYGNGFSRKDPDSNILQTEEHKKWARRNNNNTNRDTLNVARKTDRLTTKDFMLDKGIIDKIEPWEEMLKTGEYNEALDYLLCMTSKELGISIDDQVKKGLLRFFFRVKRLLRFIRKDMRNVKN